MTDYAFVAGIVDELRAEALPPSAKRVRERLGSGSLETIQRHIHEHLRGKSTGPDIEEPVADPAAVAMALTALRLETATMRATIRAGAAERRVATPVSTLADAQSRWAAMAHLRQRPIPDDDEGPPSAA